MANLTTAEKKEIAEQINSELSRRHIKVSFPKSTIVDMITVIDDWIESNTTSFNNALPAAIKSGFTFKEKLEMFKYVLAKKWEVV